MKMTSQEIVGRIVEKFNGRGITHMSTPLEQEIVRLLLAAGKLRVDASTYTYVVADLAPAQPPR
jgi:hypothetical protein